MAGFVCKEGLSPTRCRRLPPALLSYCGEEADRLFPQAGTRSTVADYDRKCEETKQEQSGC